MVATKLRMYRTLSGREAIQVILYGFIRYVALLAIMHSSEKRTEGIGQNKYKYET